MASVSARVSKGLWSLIVFIAAGAVIALGTAFIMYFIGVQEGIYYFIISSAIMGGLSAFWWFFVMKGKKPWK